MSRYATFKQAFGPGIIFAGTAIGVSHLVQSTRAGASYGYALLWAIVIANILKYPFFEFGSRYAQATKSSLITGYARLGKAPITLYILISLISMFTVTAAVSFVTVSLISNVTGFDSLFAFRIQVILLFAFCLIILMKGQYSGLEKLIKILASLLVITVIIALVSLVLNPPLHEVVQAPKPFWEDKTQFLFLIALMGWMPTAVDLSAWNSMWTVERLNANGNKASLKEVLLDFKIGYWLSAVLAIAFLILGAELMFYQNEQFPESGPAFTATLLELFTKQVGQWSIWIISIAAISVMLSTTITVFDGYSRALSQSIKILMPNKEKLGGYNLWLIITACGALLIILLFSTRIRPLIDLATITSFLIAPIVAFFNYKLVNSNDVPLPARPKWGLNVWAIAGLIYLIVFALLYLWFVIS